MSVNSVSMYETTVNEAIVPILNRSLCNTWLAEQSLKVTDGMICAGYELGGTDACQVRDWLVVIKTKLRALETDFHT